MKIKKIVIWPFFPFILVALAILNLLITYYFEIKHQGFFFVILISLLIVSIVLALFYYQLKDLNKAALIAFFLSVFFFEFQAVIVSLRTISSKLKLTELVRFWNSDKGQLAVFCILVLAVVILYLVLKKSQKVNNRTIIFFNLFSLLLMIIFFVRVVALPIQHRRTSAEFYRYWEQHLNSLPDSTALTIGTKPDIYFIVLDGFARSDVLMELYGLDNTSFVQSLEAHGFFVGDKSYSNYNQTTLSLASTLNMIYLDEIAEKLETNSSSVYPAYYMIGHSTVEENLKKLGYQTVGFYSENNFTDFTGRDYYFKPQGIPPAFNQIYLYNTALSVFFNSKLYDWHRETVKYTLDTLPEVATLNGPQFIFAHILCPHPPFVFNSDGTPRETDRLYSIQDANRFLLDGTLDEYRNGYRDQLIYLQESILTMVKRIQETSNDPFILILQGDHGPGSETNQDRAGLSNDTERHSILNAIYFFDQDYGQLYSEISPVNTFRIIFSQYLGFDEPLLDDLHYASTYNDSFNFVQVDNLLK